MPSWREYTDVEGTRMGLATCRREGIRPDGGVQVAEPLVGALGVGPPPVPLRERAAEGDHLPDLPGVQARDLPGEDAAEAPAHQRHGSPGPLGVIRERPRKLLEHLLGRPAIAPEAPPAHVVTQQAQEPPQRERARVGGQQARQHQHPVAVAARRGRQPRRGEREDGQVDQTPDRLGQQQRGRRAGRPAAGRVGRRVGVPGGSRSPSCSPDEVHHGPLRIRRRRYALGRVVIHL